MSLIPDVTRRDIVAIGEGIGSVGSHTMNPPTPQEYGRQAVGPSQATVACWGGTGSNQTGL